MEPPDEPRTSPGRGDLAERKALLRARLRERRRSVAPAEAEAAGRAVASRVAALPEYQAARTLALYAALPDELPTRPLFEAARRAGKEVRLPRLDASGALVFAAVERWEDLRPGRYGVPEPPPEAQPRPPGELVVVPGVAFDRACHRLGRGGGHYDRALVAAAARGALRVGLAYHFEVVEAVPHGPDDQRMDVVVSERETWRAGSAGGEAP